MSLAEILAAGALVSLVLYALSAGADFGGGILDLLASGPRKEQQQKEIERAIAPIWEANHVWMILVVVILFAAFPPAFAAITIGLHVPLTLMLLGIVVRGSAFVFRQYGSPSQRQRRRWGGAFAASSVATPVCLGLVVAGLTGGGLRGEHGVPAAGFVAPWLTPLGAVMALLALAAFTHLAAVYMTVEAADDLALAEDFRRRAVVSWVALALVAVTCLLVLPDAFRTRLPGPSLVVGALLAMGSLACLLRRRLRLARVLAAGEVATLVIGWGLGQRPYLVAPDVTIEGAAAPASTLRLLLIALGAGSVLLFPSLYWMLRVFKHRRT